MDMTGERRIPAPRQKVWNSLNDPQVLRACIPGCEKLERTGDNAFTATAGVKIGPISARFNGRVNLLDIDEPNSYRIEGEGQGGVAGFAKGGATVRLADDGPFTLLTYEAKAQVGGKIAQLGARLVDATSKQMADQFFNRFTNEVSGPAEIVAEGTAGVTAAAAGDAPTIAAPSPERAATPAAPHAAPNQPVPQARPNAIRLLDLIPAEPFGFPRVAWIGCALYAVVFILLFSGYVLG
jgi:carbon monoxide dehydrogenase subunit G